MAGFNKKYGVSNNYIAACRNKNKIRVYTYKDGDYYFDEKGNKLPFKTGMIINNKRAKYGGEYHHGNNYNVVWFYDLINFDDYNLKIFSCMLYICVNENIIRDEIPKIIAKKYKSLDQLTDKQKELLLTIKKSIIKHLSKIKPYLLKEADELKTVFYRIFVFHYLDKMILKNNDKKDPRERFEIEFKKFKRSRSLNNR